MSNETVTDGGGDVKRHNTPRERIAAIRVGDVWETKDGPHRVVRIAAWGIIYTRPVEGRGEEDVHFTSGISRCHRCYRPYVVESSRARNPVIYCGRDERCDRPPEPSPYNPAHRFDLPYLVDNGTPGNWPTAVEAGCVLVRWHDDDTFSVLDAKDQPIGWGETKEDALNDARYTLTNAARRAGRKE